MKPRHQITINGTTWCQIHDGSWIGPDLRAPGLITRLRLWLAVWRQRGAA